MQAKLRFITLCVGGALGGWAFVVQALEPPAFAPPTASVSGSGTPTPSGQPAPAQPAPITGETPVQFVLLSNDQIMEGQLRKGTDGYWIKRSGADVFLPEHRVAAVADSKEALFEHKRRSIPEHDLHEHLRLSKWCLAKGLHDQSIAELEHILKLDPAHPQAARQLQSMMSWRQNVERHGQVVDHQAFQRPAPFDAPAFIDSFIRGNGQESFDTYIRLERVLLNRCAASGCHGSTLYTGEFRLFRRSGAHDQKLTARNLQTIRNMIRLDDPNNSTILYHAINAHGSLSVPPLGGVNDPDFRQLRDWVVGYANRYRFDKRVEWIAADRPEAPPSDVVFGSSRTMTARTEQFQRPQAPANVPGDDVSERAFRGAADDAPEPKPARGKPLFDPFDPSDFNGEEPSAAPPTSKNEQPSRAGKRVGRSDRQASPTDNVLIPVGREGKVFEAAPPPINLRRASSASKTSKDPSP